VKATDPTIENFLHAGLVPLGRSSTPEFGLTFDTLTEYDGEVTVTRNPWNLERTSGGSSGGSGVVAATGIVPLSMSSDGGGLRTVPRVRPDPESCVRPISPEPRSLRNIGTP
jgi:amidase